MESSRNSSLSRARARRDALATASSLMPSSDAISRYVKPWTSRKYSMARCGEGRRRSSVRSLGYAGSAVSSLLKRENARRARIRPRRSFDARLRMTLNKYAFALVNDDNECFRNVRSKPSWTRSSGSTSRGATTAAKRRSCGYSSAKIAASADTSCFEFSMRLPMGIVSNKTPLERESGHREDKSNRHADRGGQLGLDRCIATTLE